MRRRPANASGYINLPQNNFQAMVERVTSPKDVEVLKDAYYNFVGHRNIIPQKMVDQLMFKAL
jgi:hypothetical protein